MGCRACARRTIMGCSTGPWWCMTLSMPGAAASSPLDGRRGEKRLPYSISAERKATDGSETHGVSFAEAVRVWARVALLSFGGPAGQIAVMHRILVEEKR